MHWSLVATVTAAWLTRERLDDWHSWFGYATVAILALRIIWGYFGSHYARFSQFIRPPKATWHYAREIVTGTAPRYLGHNPLGGWMIVTLLITLATLDFTGWLATTDRFWGYAWLANLHEALGWALLSCVGVHISGVVFMSVNKRENLVVAMICGSKTKQHPSDVD